jgi:hypothetical protein
MLFAADYEDDFSGYTTGDDLDVSPYWHWTSGGGIFEFAEFGGDDVIESDFDSYDLIGYGCMGSGVFADGSVTMDYRFTGQECMFAVLIRVNDSTNQAYAGGLYCSQYAPLGGFFIAYVDATGNYTELVREATTSATANTWHELTLEASGSNPVSLVLKHNGSQVATASDTTHLLPVGLTGFGCGFENAEANFIADNFIADDASDGSAIEEATFGEIKAMF